jgi:RNA polymerase sigma factor (sigma-70 family)
MTTGLAQFAKKVETRNDLDLVHATQGGDMSAFEQLVGRYDRRLLRIAEHITHNREDSQDVVQEAFLQAFQHMGDFQERSLFSTWLIRINVNQALLKLRKRRTGKEGTETCFRSTLQIGRLTLKNTTGRLNCATS